MTGGRPYVTGAIFFSVVSRNVSLELVVIVLFLESHGGIGKVIINGILRPAIEKMNREKVSIVA